MLLNIYFALPALLIATFCLRGGFGILRSWKDKKRKYDVLIARNSETFRPETFTEFMQAPCGRLLSVIVLRDLKIPEKYAELKVLRKPLLQRIKIAFTKRSNKTIIHSFTSEN